MDIKAPIKMTRPTRIHINESALVHNLERVRRCAPGKKIIAMVKANAYGCGLSIVLRTLDGRVDAFGVASLEEAMTLRALGSHSDCLLLQGVFNPEEFKIVAKERLQCVIHQPRQLQWLLTTPLMSKIKVWVKVNTGMHRLGFPAHGVEHVIRSLLDCPWVDADIGLMTHMASADEPELTCNQDQLQCFNSLSLPKANLIRSIANSAAILALPAMHADVVRPGLMLYGVSPFKSQTGTELGLMPVMRFMSAVTTIHHYPPYARIGYSGTWHSDKPTIIGIVPVGYGDGYPRHLTLDTPTWVNGYIAPVVGRVSMDMLTINLTDCPGVLEGDPVELWGQHVPIETIAKSAETIPYELLCKMTSRVRV